MATVVHAQPTDDPPKWALPKDGLFDGSKAEIENKPCCAPSGGGPVRISDAAVLATVPGIASRDGSVLRLKLADNRTFKLTDCNDASRLRDYDSASTG